MKLYKLTDEKNQTRGGCQWGEGVTHETSGQGEMCGPGWLHAYSHPLLAVLLNPIHANFTSPVLWEAEGEIEKDDKLKVATRKLTTVRIIPLPEITTTQKVKFAILCAKKVCADPAWNLWADKWLSGEDRTADAAARTADAAARAKADAAKADAAKADAAAKAAVCAWAAKAADAADARAAAKAADAAAKAAAIDLVAIAEEAIL